MSIFDTLYGYGQNLLTLIPGQGSQSQPPQSTLQQSSIPVPQPSTRLPDADFTNVPAQQPPQQVSPTAPTTVYVRGGSGGGQIEVKEGKVWFDPVGGSYEVYQVPPSPQPGFTRTYGIAVSGGGSGALQGGGLSEKPLSPLIYTQEGRNTLSPTSVPGWAQAVQANPDLFSRPGAERYGGYVLPLSAGPTYPNAQYGQYPAGSGNLARLADPYGVNRPKTTWSELPWQMENFAGAPTYQDVTKAAPAQQGRLQPLAGQAFGGTMLTAPEKMPLMGEEGGLKAPFVSVGKSGTPLPEWTKTGSTLIPSEFAQKWISSPYGENVVTPYLIGASDWFMGSSNPVAGMLKMLQTSILGRDVFARSTIDTYTGKPVYGEPIISKSLEVTPPKVTSVYNPATGETLITTTSLETLTETTKQPVTTPMKTVITPMKGGFDIGEERASEYTKKWLPEMNPARPTGNVALDYFAGFGRGVYEGIRTKPLTSLTNVGIGLGMVAGGEAIAGLGSATTTAATGTRLYPVAKGLEFGATKVLPAALVTVYGADVYGRTTEWGKDYSPKAAERFGVISGQEIIPFIGGGMLYSPLKTGVRMQETLKTGVRMQEIDIKSFVQEKYNLRPKQYGEVGARQATGIAADYIKTSAGEGIDIGTKPYRAYHNEYLALKMEIETMPLKTGETRRSFTSSDYLKYKVSQSGQYLMAQGEAGLMRAGEIGTAAKGIPLELTTRYFDTKMGVQTKAAELSLDYARYTQEPSVFVTPKGKVLYELQQKGTSYGDVEHWAIFSKDTGKLMARGFGTQGEAVGYGEAASRISRATYPEMETIGYHTHPEQFRAGQINAMNRLQATPSVGDMALGAVYAEGGHAEFGVIGKKGAMKVETTPSGAGAERWRYSRRIYEKLDIAYQKGIEEGAPFKSTDTMMKEWINRAGELGYKGEVISKEIPRTISKPEANIIGYVQSKLYPAYFEAKVQAPVMAEKALISGEVSFWKAGQYAKTPGINIKAFMQGEKPVSILSVEYVPKVGTRPLDIQYTPRTKYDFGGTGKGEGVAPAIRKGYGGEGGQAITQAPSEKLFGGKIGRPSETMKPWDLTQTKQSATAIQMYRTEPLPGMEPVIARGRVAPPMATGLFQVQVPRTRVQTEDIFGETATRPRQQQPFIKAILPEFAVAPASRQVYAAETILAQEQTRRKITPVMMSYDVLTGQRQRTVQQLAVGLEFGTTIRRAQESQRRQKYITGIDTGVRLRQDTSIFPRTSTLIDTGVAYRQRQDIIVTPRITQIPRITTTTITSGGLGGPFSGGSSWSSYLKGKRQHLEFFPIGHGISDMDILGKLAPAKIKTNVRTVYGEERGSFKTHSGTSRVKELPPGSKIVVQKGGKPKSPRQSVYGTKQGKFSTFSGGINIKGAKRKRR